MGVLVGELLLFPCTMAGVAGEHKCSKEGSLAGSTWRSKDDLPCLIYLNARSFIASCFLSISFQSTGSAHCHRSSTGKSRFQSASARHYYHTLVIDQIFHNDPFSVFRSLLSILSTPLTRLFHEEFTVQ